MTLSINMTASADAKTKVWCFENLSVFQALSLSERKSLASRAYQWYAAKGEPVFLPDQAANAIFILKDGRVKISRRAEDGREVITSILLPGEIFGELALVGEGRRDSLAITLERSYIYAVPIDHFKAVLSGNPSFNLEVTRLVGKRLLKIQSRLASLCFQSAPERIRGLIRESALEYGRKIGEDIEIKVVLKHDEIAQLTGTSRQTVTQVLGELEKNNLILYDRRRILVRNLSAL